MHYALCLFALLLSASHFTQCWFLGLTDGWLFRCSPSYEVIGEELRTPRRDSKRDD